MNVQIQLVVDEDLPVLTAWISRTERTIRKLIQPKQVVYYVTSHISTAVLGLRYLHRVCEHSVLSVVLYVL